jgi:hypothetical protein
MLSGPTFRTGIYGRSSRQQTTELLADAAQRDGGGIWRAKREESGRDFTHGKPSHFVILGIGFTAVFALTLFAIVKLVLHFAGV